MDSTRFYFDVPKSILYDFTKYPKQKVTQKRLSSYKQKQTGWIPIQHMTAGSQLQTHRLFRSNQTASPCRLPSVPLLE